MKKSMAFNRDDRGKDEVSTEIFSRDFSEEKRKERWQWIIYFIVGVFIVIFAIAIVIVYELA